MAHVLAQVRLQRTTNLPEDVIINTFHFSTSSPQVVAGDHTSIIERLTQFYKDPPVGAGASFQNQSSPVIRLAGHEIRIYHQADPIPRPVRASATFDFTSRNGNPMPSEVALVLTLESVRLAGVPAARTRGRLYLGPWQDGVTQSGVVEGDGRPPENVLNMLIQLGIRLIGVAGADLSPRWVVWSEVDQALRPVISLSCDNAWDTQRRRGAKPTKRLRGPLPV